MDSFRCRKIYSSRKCNQRYRRKDRKSTRLNSSHTVISYAVFCFEKNPQALAWKGAHLNVIFSPDGRFLVTSMQEYSLHGWQLLDAGNMRMTGYAAKMTSRSWAHD